MPPAFKMIDYFCIKLKSEIWEWALRFIVSAERWHLSLELIQQMYFWPLYSFAQVFNFEYSIKYTHRCEWEPSPNIEHDLLLKSNSWHLKFSNNQKNIFLIRLQQCTFYFISNSLLRVFNMLYCFCKELTFKIWH